jgi:hypothetical protein
MNQKELDKLILYRVKIEGKVNGLIADGSNKNENNLAAKLGKLNDRLKRYEQTASRGFLEVANQLIHSQNPFEDEIDKEAHKHNFKVLNKALDRIIDPEALKRKQSEKKIVKFTLYYMLLFIVFIIGGVTIQLLKEKYSTQQKGSFYMSEADKYDDYDADHWKGDSLRLIAATYNNLYAQVWKEIKRKEAVKSAEHFEGIDYNKAKVYWREAARFGDSTSTKFCKAHNIIYWKRDIENNIPTPKNVQSYTNEVPDKNKVSRDKWKMKMLEDSLKSASEDKGIMY